MQSYSGANPLSRHSLLSLAASLSLHPFYSLEFFVTTAGSGLRFIFASSTVLAYRCGLVFLSPRLDPFSSLTSHSLTTKKNTCDLHDLTTHRTATPRLAAFSNTRLLKEGGWNNGCCYGEVFVREGVPAVEVQSNYAERDESFLWSTGNEQDECFCWE
jgi:hypothetical protein